MRDPRAPLAHRTETDTARTGGDTTDTTWRPFFSWRRLRTYFKLHTLHNIAKYIFTALQFFYQLPRVYFNDNTRYCTGNELHFTCIPIILEAGN